MDAMFEIAQKELKNGKRRFKAILAEVYPDSTIDEVNEVGTKYNQNGISFIESYVRQNLNTIIGQFIRVEFLDEPRTEAGGHGLTDVIKGSPVFENAVTIGVFTNAYIEETEEKDGNHLYLIGEGEIDGQCYHNFIEHITNEIEDGIYPSGSVEICRVDDEPGIIYKYGWKEIGRIPTVFRFSGYAIIGVPPSDNAAKLVELNQKGDNTAMNKEEIMALIAQAVEQVKSYVHEVFSQTADYEQKLHECNEKIGTLEQEKEEANAAVTVAQSELETCKTELNSANERAETAEAAKTELETALKAANEEKKVNELNAAIEGFSEDERKYASDEIEAFHANPLECEINSVVEKIFEGIGRNAKKNEAKAQEQDEGIDIFAEVNTAKDKTDDEDDNIF